jgi:hypothetical protein
MTGSRINVIGWKIIASGAIATSFGIGMIDRRDGE